MTLEKDRISEELSEFIYLAKPLKEEDYEGNGSRRVERHAKEESSDVAGGERRRRWRRKTEWHRRRWRRKTAMEDSSDVAASLDAWIAACLFPVHPIPMFASPGLPSPAYYEEFFFGPLLSVGPVHVHRLHTLGNAPENVFEKQKTENGKPTKRSFLICVQVWKTKGFHFPRKFWKTESTKRKTENFSKTKRALINLKNSFNSLSERVSPCATNPSTIYLATKIEAISTVLVVDQEGA
ncbi:hypothetical protein LXL04_005055 [Taraxacum kok-saghyz]